MEKINERQRAGLAIGWEMAKENHPCKGKHWKCSPEHNRKISIAKKGKPLSLEHRAALSRAKIGRPIPHLHNEKVNKKISAALVGKYQPHLQNEKHHEWKGDDASYFAFHMWLRRRYGKAYRCENQNCKYPRRKRNGQIVVRPKRFEWSLIHGKVHSHQRENYWMLCKMCHVRYDMEEEI